MVRLINDPPPRNGGVIVTSTGGARVVQVKTNFFKFFLFVFVGF